MEITGINNTRLFLVITTRLENEKFFPSSHNKNMYDSEFYDNLKKPSFMPKGKIFVAVWSVLYSLMALSLFLVIMENDDEIILAVASFCVQLLLNILWPFVFFKYKKTKLALFVAILLMISVAVMIAVFWDISKLAGLLQIPYFLWSCFAIYLNGNIVALNK